MFFFSRATMLNGTKLELLDHRALDVSNDELSHAINASSWELTYKPGPSGPGRRDSKVLQVRRDGRNCYGRLRVFAP